MTDLRRAILLACALSAAGRGGTVAAQADTTRGPARDSTARDTTSRDTLPALMPTFAAPAFAGPLPAGARLTFDADSLRFSNVLTLSDLLSHVPGVYVARGGWMGQAEPVVYGGRGALGLEVYWDGVPYRPLGRDSVFLDPARIFLGPLERVDVIVLPAQLRVYLVTFRQRSTAPGSDIGITTGDLGVTGYRVGYARRWRSGAGLSLLTEWDNLDGSTSSSTSGFNSADIWLKAEYVPNGHVGASYQVLSSNWRRHGLASTVDEWSFGRRDGIVRFFLAARGDGLGPRLDGSVARAATSRDTSVADRTLYQAVLTASDVWSRASVTLTGRFGSLWTRAQVEAQAGWMPVSRLTLAADARHSEYGAGRHGDRAHASAGLTLPLGLSAWGQIGWTRELQAPSVVTDSLQTTTDVWGALRWERRPFTVEVGRGRRDPFAPLGFASGIRPVDSLGPSPAAEFMSVSASLRPLPGLQLAGWYLSPLYDQNADFEPPYHVRGSVTFYSKFWRVFRSGIFALRGELAAESWSRWRGGREAAGGVLPLPGATFVETNIEMQIAGVTIFWIRRNENATRAGYVAQLGYPAWVQVYGARWHFTN